MKFYILLFLLMVGIGSFAIPKSKTRTIRITVIDKKTNKPVDSAQLIMQTIINDLDVKITNNYTDRSGKCRISIDNNPAHHVKIGAFKKGLIGYFDGRFINLDRSFGDLTDTIKELTLFLTSDLMNHTNFWKMRAPRYDIDTLINLLRTNKYPDRSSLPLMSWEDIPRLLSIGNSIIAINHFPDRKSVV